MKDFFNKIKTYITGHKAVSIISGVVAAAVVVTVVSVSVVNHKNGVDTGFNVSTPSDENKTITAEEIAAAEANNASSEETPSEETVSEVNTIETTPNGDNNTTNNKPANSGNSNNNTVSKPSNSGNSGGLTFTTGDGSNKNTWTCPNPSEHPEHSSCNSDSMHKMYVNIHKNNLEDANKPSSRNPEDVGVICRRCGRPYGDGYNGTCFGYFCDGSYKCHHYDTGETCQIKHKG